MIHAAINLQATVLDVAAQVPNPGGGQAPPGSEGLLTILSWAAWIALALGVLGVIIAGITMMIQTRRGEGGEGLARLGWVLAGCVIVAGASGLVTAFV
jgi:type IV secretory pathway VirB2 component (pilin)